jgi:hypothetical protein
MKASLLILVLGCAPTAIAVGPEHPANPDGPTGRLAGPPPALRAGVADIAIPERANRTDHSGHGSAHDTRKQTKPPASKQTPGTQDKPKQPPAQQGHEGHH